MWSCADFLDAGLAGDYFSLCVCRLRLGEQLNSSSAYVIHDGTAWGTPGQLVGRGSFGADGQENSKSACFKNRVYNCALCIQQRSEQLAMPAAAPFPPAPALRLHFQFRVNQSTLEPVACWHSVYSTGCYDEGVLRATAGADVLNG